MRIDHNVHSANDIQQPAYTPQPAINQYRGVLRDNLPYHRGRRAADLPRRKLRFHQCLQSSLRPPRRSISGISSS